MTEILVIGSNTSGRHGLGAAKYAVEHYGLQYGIGVGRSGMAYAIPTKKDGPGFTRTGKRELVVMSIEEIKPYVDEFLRYAKEHPELTFKVTAVGTGLSGYSHETMGKLFDGVPVNCIMPKQWFDYIRTLISDGRRWHDEGKTI